MYSAMKKERQKAMARQELEYTPPATPATCLAAALAAMALKMLSCSSRAPVAYSHILQSTPHTTGLNSERPQ